jgi:hypothetical protein
MVSDNQFRSCFSPIRFLALKPYTIGKQIFSSTTKLVSKRPPRAQTLLAKPQPCSQSLRCGLSTIFLATGHQVKNQFFASLARFRDRPAFAGWNWLETELRTPHGGFLFGRATDTGGNIEGLHDQPDSPAGLLVDEAKSIRPEVLDALERCHTSYRLFMSSTGPAFGGFYQIMTAKAHLWRTFRVPSSMCPHVDQATIEADRENLKASVFAIKHDAEFLYDAGDSMISLEHARALIDNPPAFAPGL